MTKGFALAALFSYGKQQAAQRQLPGGMTPLAQYRPLILAQRPQAAKAAWHVYLAATGRATLNRPQRLVLLTASATQRFVVGAFPRRNPAQGGATDADRLGNPPLR
jgi:hypothetical protein